MAKPPAAWLQCTCGLLVRSEDATIAPRVHPTASAKGVCPGADFTIALEPTEEQIRRGRAELARRQKKRALIKGPIQRAYKQGPGTNPWEGVRATSARPSKGSAGAPTLGKKR